MAESCSDTSLTSSTTSSLVGSDQRSYNSVDSDHSNGSARRETKTSVGKLHQIESGHLNHFKRMFSDALTQQSESNTSFREATWKQQDPLALHNGLEAIASSLSLLTKSLGMALEEQQNHMEMTANSSTNWEDGGRLLNKTIDAPNKEKELGSPPKLQVCSEKRLEPEVTKDTQMKTSRDIAMAMTTKAKLLLRELKRIRSDLNFTKDRCAQLEEENRRLREGIDKGVRHEEDDLVRLQLEALLMEKARLAQENAAYARENQFLHEVVQYHQVKLRNIDLPDESLLAFDDDELSLDVRGLEMDFLPMYPAHEENHGVPEESLEMMAS